MIQYTIFTNTGKTSKKTPDETVMLYVEVFGNAEKIQCFDKDNHRIWMNEPEYIYTNDYIGYYTVYIDELEEWRELAKICKSAEERMKRFRERIGMDK